MKESKTSVLYEALEEIRGGSRVIDQLDVRIDQSIGEDLRILKRHLGEGVVETDVSGVREWIARVLRELAYFVYYEAEAREKTHYIKSLAHELVRKSNRLDQEVIEGPDTILLVLPSSVELPAKGELETDELIRLIEESHFLRCLEREEAREVFAEVTAPEQKGTEDRIIRVSLGKKIKPNLRKYMLMDVIAATRVQAQMEEIDNLALTADLPGFV